MTTKQEYEVVKALCALGLPAVQGSTPYRLRFVGHTYDSEIEYHKTHRKLNGLKLTGVYGWLSVCMLNKLMRQHRKTTKLNLAKSRGDAIANVLARVTENMTT